MRRFLIFASLLWLSFQMPCLSAEAESMEYQLYMQARGHEVTGICMMQETADNQIVGTVVNEFGVKAFDFSYANGKAKVFNVVGPLNKWYIRKVLKGDFRFILSHLSQGKDAVKKKRKITFLPNGDISVSNDRYRIYYTFTPMNQDVHETDQ